MVTLQVQNVCSLIEDKWYLTETDLLSVGWNEQLPETYEPKCQILHPVHPYLR